MPEKLDLFTAPDIERQIAVYRDNVKLHLFESHASTQPWRTLINSMHQDGRNCAIIIGTKIQPTPGHYAYPLLQDYQTKGVELPSAPGQCLGRILLRPINSHVELHGDHNPTELHMNATAYFTLIYPNGDAMQSDEVSIATAVRLTLASGALKFGD